MVLLNVDNHIKKLLNACHLCCGKIKLDNYNTIQEQGKVSEYEDEIRKVFVYDTCIDISGVHPLYVCSSCCRKLDHYYTNNIQINIIHQRYQHSQNIVIMTVP